MYNTLLLEYIHKLIDTEGIALLTENEIPLIGPNGIRKFLGQLSVEAFTVLYFPEEFTIRPFPKVHVDMLEDLQDITDRLREGKSGVRLAKAIPRNHAKSTYYSRILPIYCFVYNLSPLTILLGNNDNAARRLVQNIKNELESNQRLLTDFPLLRGNTWGVERLESKSGSTIVSFGVGSGSIRGVSNGANRPTLVISDDIDDDKSVRSALELANNRDWYDKTVMAVGDNVKYTTSFIIVGTLIRRTSLLQYIIDKAEYKSTIQSAVLSFATNKELWETWASWFIEQAKNGNAPLDAEEDTFYQEHKEAMLEGTQMLWDRPDAYYRAMRYKLDSEKAFWSELQNAPKETDSPFGNVSFIDLDVINENEYHLLAALDPTIKGNKHNDLAAFVEILYHPKRKEIIVSYIDAKQRSYAETIVAVTQRLKTRGRRYDGLWVEENSHGTIIRDKLQEDIMKAGLTQLARPIYNTLPKNERINALSIYIERQQLFFTKHEGLEEELQSWPFSKHDDILDAIAMIVLELEKTGKLDLQIKQ